MATPRPGANMAANKAKAFLAGGSVPQPPGIGKAIKAPKPAYGVGGGVTSVKKKPAPDLAVSMKRMLRRK